MSYSLIVMPSSAAKLVTEWPVDSYLLNDLSSDRGIWGQKTKSTIKLNYLHAASPFNDTNSFHEVNKHSVKNYSLISSIYYEESSHSVTLQCGRRLHCNSRIVNKEVPKPMQAIWPRFVLPQSILNAAYLQA